MSGENILERFLMYVKSEFVESFIHKWLYTKTATLSDLETILDELRLHESIFDQLEADMEGFIDIYEEDFK